jgi:hypothetical protein
VEKDTRSLARSLKAAGLKDKTTLAAFSDPLPAHPTGGDGLMINLVIGTRDDLSVAHAKASARKWREATRQYPKAIIYLCFLGYDEDPRELPALSEVARYVRGFAHEAGINDFDEAIRGPLGEMGAAFLAACGVFGEELRRSIEMPPAPTAQ